MRRPLVALAATAALAASTFGTAAAAQAAPPEPSQYLALGDSYPEGLPGVGEDAAYPALLAQRAPQTVLDNQAVSGARSTDVPGQVTSGNDVITLTVGANDVGWTQTLLACSQNPAACTIDTAKVASLTAGLATTITLARQENEAAEIFVAGYPELFNAQAAALRPCSVGPLPGTQQDVVVTGEQASTVNALVIGLNTIIASTVGASGATYVDVSASFANHRLCDSSPWLYDLNSYPASFHPTAAGQRAYAQAINRAGFRDAVLPGNRAPVPVG